MTRASSPTAGLLRAANGELHRIQRALDTLLRRRETLAAELAELDAEAETLRERQRLLAVLVGEPAETTDDVVAREDVPLLQPIRGRELRMVASRVLWDALGREEIHYRDWYERVLRDGYAVGGKDPVASFLTNIRDSPIVVRGSRQGFYRLDPARRDRIEASLGETAAELADVEEQLRLSRERRESEDIERLRLHRDQLVAEGKRLRSALEEFHAVLDRDGGIVERAA